MREILFRGKRLDNGEWVQGYYVKCFDPGCGPNETRHYIEEYPGAWYEVDPSTVGQYTGLTDTNGKRIFEGDIVEGPDFDEEDGYAVIKWDDDAARFVVTGRYLTVDFDNYWGHDLEVIGNIHDDKELLGGADNEL